MGICFIYMVKNALKIGIIGLGYWGANLLRIFSQLSRIEKIYIYDIDNSKLNNFQSKYTNVEIAKTLEEFLEFNLNGVVISTPAKTHYELSKYFLMHNINVLVEKPICLTPDEAFEIVNIAKKNQLILMVDHTFIYNDAVRKVKEIIDKGELGDILYITTERLNLGKIRSDVNVWWNLAPHDVSIIYYLLNKTPISYVAKGMSFFQKGIHDVVFCSLTFPDNILVNINVSWLHPLKIRRITIVGTKKMLIYDDVSTNSKITIYDKGFDKIPFPKELPQFENFGQFQLQQRNGDVLIPYFEFKEPLHEMANHFIDCIINNIEPLTNGGNSLPIVEILYKVNQLLCNEKN